MQILNHVRLVRRVAGAVLLAAGLFMIGAAFLRRFADTATSLAALVYLSYACARGLSMALDGAPAAGLVQAAALEAVLGLACLALVTARRLPSWRTA